MFALSALLINPRTALAGGGGGGGGTSPTTQLRSWRFTSTRIDFSSGTAVATDLNPNGTNQVATAAFDASNNMLFYVANGSFSKAIIGPNGQQVGALTSIVNPDKSPLDESDWNVIGREVVVVPVPNQCSRYYLFYTLSSNYSTVVASAIIDCSNGTTIAQNSQRVGSDVHNGPLHILIWGTCALPCLRSSPLA